MKFGFIIICPDRNLGGLKSTVKSIREFFSQHPYFCILSNDAIPSEINEFERICPIFTGGGGSITSLINLGIRKATEDWNFIFFAGTILRPNTIKKYLNFVKHEKQIFYPVINKKWVFDEASINGILLHKNAIRDIGEFAEKLSNLQIVKLFWALDAMEKGYQLNALVGTGL